MAKKKRNIGQEILDSIREIKAGGGRRYRVLTKDDCIKARKEVGLSQANWADMLCIPKRTVQDWEQGRRQPDQAAQTLLTIAAKRPDVILEVLGDRGAVVVHRSADGRKTVKTIDPEGAPEVLPQLAARAAQKARRIPKRKAKR